MNVYTWASPLASSHALRASSAARLCTMAWSQLWLDFLSWMSAGVVSTSPAFISSAGAVPCTGPSFPQTWDSSPVSDRPTTLSQTYLIRHQALSLLPLQCPLFSPRPLATGGSILPQDRTPEKRNLGSEDLQRESMSARVNLKMFAPGRGPCPLCTGPLTADKTIRPRLAEIMKEEPCEPAGTG